MPGRKTKLTPEIQERVVVCSKLGMSDELSAHFAGISCKTLQRWMRRGEQSKSPEHRMFYQAVAKARSDLVQRALLVIDNAAIKGDWRAATWKLERMYPNEFGRNRNLERELVCKGSKETTAETKAMVDACQKKPS